MSLLAASTLLTLNTNICLFSQISIIANGNSASEKEMEVQS